MALSRSNKQMIVGLAVLLVVIGAAVAYMAISGSRPQEVTLSGYVGGEKTNFLEDPEVKTILKNDFGITLDVHKAGSLDMVRAKDLADRNFLWPSSQTALELYEDTVGPTYKDDNIFNTPIVLYSRAYVADGLVAAGLASKENDTYLVDMPALVTAMKEDKTWADIGLTQLYGSISIHTTDPSKSNSGNMFSGLIANMLNNNTVVTEAQVPSILPDLTRIFDKIGYMETSSSDLFTLFLTTGMGNKPIVAGYENQLLEFSSMNNQEWQNVKSDIVIMYPTPTVWSSHIFIALDSEGEKLMTALKDPRLQQIAWEKHGFRTGVYGSTSQENKFDVPGVANQITQIIQMPGYKAMSQIVAAFE